MPPPTAATNGKARIDPHHKSTPQQFSPILRKSIDQLLVILSLDCFVNYIWEGEDSTAVRKIKNLARFEFKNILDGSSNYYMNADFSAARLEKTQDDFYNSLAEFLEKIQIDYVKSLQCRIEDKKFSKLSEAVAPVLADLLWLNQQSISQPICDNLLRILSKVEESGIGLQEIEIDHEDINFAWKNSKSEWDRFMRQESMFEDIDDVPCLIIYKALRLDSSIIFLRKANSVLTRKDFSDLICFLINEVDSNKTTYNQNDNETAQTILKSYIN
ncbi:hypothetical protein [Paracidovorax oryzae]|uniref:hypothetical protein n=1 Tax=Paracidovorax oryzae TaxID=862720 RepID=UPI0035CE8628